MLTFRPKSKLIAGTVALAMTVSFVSVPTSFAADSHPQTPMNSPQETDHPSELHTSMEGQTQEWEDGLDYIMSIPDEILLQGDEATQKWVEEHPATPATQEGQFVTYANKLACTGAILTMIAGNTIAAAKLLRIKRYIKALGGVKDAVQLMWGASFSEEKLLAAGGALGALAAELTGVAAIQSQCFE